MAANDGRPLAVATRQGERRAFATVLLVEVWERFGYYGVQSLMLLFMVERLRLPDRTATLLLGAFSALVYATPAVGGWIGDRVLGAKRTVACGAAVLAAGYGLMAMPGGTTLLLLAMAVVVVGNGLFKPNVANLVRRIFDGDAARLDSAFTLYYMAVNVGSTVSTLLCPFLKDRYGWRVAFGVCCVGLALGLAQFLLLRRRLAGVGSAADHAPVVPARATAVVAGVAAATALVLFVLREPAVARASVWCVGAAIVAIWAWFFARAGAHDRRGLAILYVLVAQTILFFIFYQQMATSLTLFALRDVDLRFGVLGVTLFRWSPAQFQALDPIFIMILSPVLAVLYARAGARGADLHVASKFTIGFALTASAFLVWWLSATGASGPVSSWVMVAGYGLLAAGELLVSGLGLAVVARYVPAGAGGFMMGSYFVAVGIALYLGSAVANLVGSAGAGAGSLAAYGHLFRGLFLLGAAATLVSALALPMVLWLERSRRRDPGGARPAVPYPASLRAALRGARGDVLPREGHDAWTSASSLNARRASCRPRARSRCATTIRD